MKLLKLCILLMTLSACSIIQTDGRFLVLPNRGWIEKSIGRDYGKLEKKGYVSQCDSLPIEVRDILFLERTWTIGPPLIPLIPFPAKWGYDRSVLWEDKYGIDVPTVYPDRIVVELDLAEGTLDIIQPRLVFKGQELNPLATLNESKQHSLDSSYTTKALVFDVPIERVTEFKLAFSQVDALCSLEPISYVKQQGLVYVAFDPWVQ